MKQIYLTRGKIAIVDDEDFEKINQYKWHYMNTGYAARDFWIEGKSKKILMHRFILNFPEKPVDHIDGNRLDNRKKNLRAITQQQNIWNMHKIPSHNKSGFIGVSWQINRKKWQVGIKVSGKRIHIGNFLHINDAVKAYKLAKIKYHRI